VTIDNRYRGIACIVTSAFGFALMAFFVRLCDDYGGLISCFQKGFFRNFIALLIAAVVFVRAARKSSLSQLPSKSAYPALLARCLFGSFGIFANFYALSHIQVGEAMALNKTAPFFTVFASWLCLKEKVTRIQFVCLVVAFAGAMMVVKPGFRLNDAGASFLGLSSGLGAGLAYACVHRLGRMKVSGSFIVLVFSAFSCLASVPFIVVDFHPMTLAQVVILVGAGVGAAIGQFGITAAYRFAEPRSIAAFDYVGVVFSSLFGFLFFAQVPDSYSVLGFALIVASAFFLSARSHCGNRHKFVNI